MKYIIELQKIEGTDLYKAVGANTLVFDKYGIDNILTPYEKVEPVDYDKMLVGDRFRLECGDTLYEFKGLSTNADRINAVDIKSGRFTNLPSGGNYVRIKS